MDHTQVQTMQRAMQISIQLSYISVLPQVNDQWDQRCVNVNVQAVLVGSEKGDNSTEDGTGPETETGPSDQGPSHRLKYVSTDYEDDNSQEADGHHVEVDCLLLDCLIKELIYARDAISRKVLQIKSAKTQRMKQDDILLRKWQDS